MGRCDRSLQAWQAGLMAICGRCGLWNQYPEEHPEKKWAGVCLWYQVRLAPGEVWEKRSCKDFFERVPQLSPVEHFDFKVKRDNLGDAYDVASRAKGLSYVGITISLASLGWGILKEIL